MTQGLVEGVGGFLRTDFAVKTGNYQLVAGDKVVADHVSPATRLTFTLPATGCPAGSILLIQKGANTGGFRIAQNVSQKVFIHGSQGTTGASGYWDSSSTNAYLALVCVVANTEFYAFEVTGTFTSDDSKIRGLGNNAYLDSNGMLVLPTTGSTGGLLIGGDLKVYRSGAGIFTNSVDGDATNIRFHITAGGSNRVHYQLTKQGLVDWSFGMASASNHFRLNFGSDLGGPDFLVATTTGQIQLPVTGATGGLLIGGDAPLYRGLAGVLTANGGGGYESIATAANMAFRTSQSGDTSYRFSADHNGKLQWGPGNAGQDMVLYRSSAGNLTMVPIGGTSSSFTIDTVSSASSAEATLVLAGRHTSNPRTWFVIAGGNGSLGPGVFGVRDATAGTNPFKINPTTPDDTLVLNVNSAEGAVIRLPSATTAPGASDFAQNGSVKFTRASDTSLRISMKGSDGTVRHTTIAVA